jgi:hypothetical protein
MVVSGQAGCRPATFTMLDQTASGSLSSCRSTSRSPMTARTGASRSPARCKAVPRPDGPTSPDGARVEVHNTPGAEVGPGQVVTWGGAADEVDVFGFQVGLGRRLEQALPVRPVEAEEELTQPRGDERCCCRAKRGRGWSRIRHFQNQIGVARRPTDRSSARRCGSNPTSASLPARNEITSAYAHTAATPGLPAGVTARSAVRSLSSSVRRFAFGISESRPPSAC